MERFGSYEVYEQVGKGGMAVVHRAALIAGKGEVREVALKRLLPTTNRELIAHFLGEARVLRYLRHPNITAGYDSGKIFGTYFIAMEFVRGPTLKELVQHCGTTVGAVPQTIALNLAAQLCDGLDHAHNARDEHGAPLAIVHRDITPANILVSDAGVLKVIDFGLAKAKVQTEQSGAHIIKGKLGYVAPEYLEGKIDHRADLWAAGIIMYELLTSRRLFDGPDGLETMKRVRQFPIPRPSLGNPQVSRELDEIVMRALARDPDQRWQSAAAMRDALQGVIAQPGRYADAQHVADWVRWVFTQTPIPPESESRPVRLVEPQPGLDENTLVDKDEHSFHRAIAAVRREETGGEWKRSSLVWLACAGVFALVVVAVLIWRLAK